MVEFHVNLHETNGACSIKDYWKITYTKALLKHIINTQASGVFIVGDKEPLSTTRLVRLVSKASNKKVVLCKVPRFILAIVRKIKPSIVDRLFGSLELDNTNTNKVLNFTPPFSSEQGIREMVEWYRKSKK